MKKVTKRSILALLSTGCVFFSLMGSAFATTTIYPSNHPNHQVEMNGFECSVDGQPGVVTSVPGYPNGEGCAISSIIIYDTGAEEAMESARERTVMSE
jgi:hypothetical protein